MVIVKYRTVDTHQEYYEAENAKKLNELLDNESGNLYDCKGNSVDSNYKGHKYRVIGIKEDFTPNSTLRKIVIVVFIVLSLGILLFFKRFRDFYNLKAYTCLLAPENKDTKPLPAFIISNKLCNDVEQLIIKKLDPHSIHRLLMTKPNLPKHVEFLWNELFKTPIPHRYAGTEEEFERVYLDKIALFSPKIQEINFSESGPVFAHDKISKTILSVDAFSLIFQMCQNLEKIKYRHFSLPKVLPQNLLFFENIEKRYDWAQSLSWDTKRLFPTIKSDVNIQSWPCALQTLSLHAANSITPLSFEKLPPYLTSLYLQNADLLSGKINLILPPALTYFRYNFIEIYGHVTFQWPVTLSTLELGDKVSFNQEYLNGLPSRITALSIDNSSYFSAFMIEQLPKYLLSLDLRHIHTSLNSLPNSLTSLTVVSFRSVIDKLPDNLISFKLYGTIFQTPPRLVNLHQITSLTIGSLGDLKIEHLPKTLIKLKISYTSTFVDADISKLPRALQILRLGNLSSCSEKCIGDLPSSLTKLTLENLSRQNVETLLPLNLEDLNLLPKSLTLLKISNVVSEVIKEWGKKNLSCRWELA